MPDTTVTSQIIDPISEDVNELERAIEGALVHIQGPETITGLKIFTQAITSPQFIGAFTGNVTGGITNGILLSNLDMNGFELTGFTGAGLGLEELANRGVANGYAPLGATALVAAQYLGTGGVGGGTKFLADDGTFKTVSTESTFEFDPQAANTIFAGPASGADAEPTFRALVANDIPTVLRATTFTSPITLPGEVNEMPQIILGTTTTIGALVNALDNFYINSVPANGRVVFGRGRSGFTGGVESMRIMGGVNIGGTVDPGATHLTVIGDVKTTNLHANSTTFNLVNATPTTVNFAGAATSLNMGSIASGVTTLNSPTVSLSGTLLQPVTAYNTNLGSLSKKFLSLHAAELWVETLVAQDTMATIGGRILVGPTTSLIADLSTGATTIDVKHNNLASGDRVYMEADLKVEFMAVTSGATVITGGFRYSVTRNLDGTGANEWFAGDAVFNTGTTGNGFIDLYSVRGVKAATEVGPTIVGNVRNSATYNDWSARWAIGNLKGLYDYGTTIFGAAFGRYATAGQTWLSVDETNGFRVVNNVTTRIWLKADGSGYVANSLIAWDTSGNLTVTGNATIGGFSIGTDYIRDVANSFGLASTVTGGDDVRFWAGNTFANRGTAPFRLTEAGALTATSATIAGSITATGGTIGGWTINSTYIAKDTGTNATSAGLAPTDFPFFAGGTFANRATAPFRVTPAGALTASNATIAGSVTATSGALGGWTMGATSLISGSGANTVGLDSGGTNPAIYAGSATPGSAPFRVTQAGALTATNATISGSVTATGGTIGGFNIGADYIRDTANSFGLASTVTGGDDVRFWAGNTFASRATAPFRLTEAGLLTATSATITGAITATSGSITGLLTLSGASGAISLGTTPPSSATVGTGIWLDRTGLYALSANTQEVTLTSAGLTAGGGNVVLDSTGLSFTSTTAYSPVSAVEWLSGSTLVGSMFNVNSSGVSGVSDSRIQAIGLASATTGFNIAGLEAYNSGVTNGGAFRVYSTPSPLRTYFTFEALGASPLTGVRIGGTGVPGHTLDVYGDVWIDTDLEVEDDLILGGVLNPNGDPLIMGALAGASTTPNAEIRLGRATSAITDDVLGMISFYTSDASSNAAGRQCAIKAITSEAGGRNSALAFFAGTGTEDSSVEVMRCTATRNLKLGGTAARAAVQGTFHIDIFDGTAPTGTMTNGISLFSVTGKLKSIDAAGLAGHVLSASALNVVAPTAPNRTLTVDVNGTTLYLAAKTTND